MALGGVPAVVGGIHVVDLPMLLAHALFDDAPDFTQRSAAFDLDIEVSESFSVHEGETLLGEMAALTFDVFAFAVVVLVVFHSCSVLFSYTPIAASSYKSG